MRRFCSLSGSSGSLALRYCETVALEDDPGAASFRAGDLGERCIERHDNGRGDSHLFGEIGDTLGMVASRAGDHAAAGCGVDHAQAVARATCLERAGDLQAFELEENLASRLTPGAATVGVRTTSSAISSAAVWISAMVTVMASARARMWRCVGLRRACHLTRCNDHSAMPGPGHHSGVMRYFPTGPAPS